MLERKADSSRVRNITQDDLDAVSTKFAQVTALEDAREALSCAEQVLAAQQDELESTRGRFDAERRRFRLLFESVLDVCIVTDRMGVIHDANPSAIELLGGDYNAIRDRPLAAFVERQSVARLREMTQAVPNDRLEATVVLGDRKARYAAVQLRAQLFGGPHSILWVGTPTSITSGMFNAESPRQSQRSSAAPSSSGRHEQRALAYVSHELNAPVHTMLGWMGLLRSGQLAPSEQEKALDVIERSLVTHAALVAELLDVSRLTTHGLALTKTPIDLSRAITFAIDAARPAAQRGGLALEDELDQEVLVCGDEFRITQIATNLLSNALKFTPRGGVITVRVRRRSELAVFSVADTGRGLRPESLGSVFDCFAQEQTESTKADGMGLGLFLVKELVELHGGTVEAFSDGPGRGSTFVVKLPLHAG